MLNVHYCLSLTFRENNLHKMMLSIHIMLGEYGIGSRPPIYSLMQRTQHS